MPKVSAKSTPPPPVKAVHNSKGEVTIINARRSGNLWLFVCQKANGRPVSLRVDQQYWQSDISPILKQYEHRMSGSEFRINPKLLVNKVSLDEYKSARAWHKKYGKSLPKVINYGRYADRVRRTLGNRPVESPPEEFDQDSISELLSSNPSHIEQDEAEDYADVRRDEASADERAGLINLPVEEKEAISVDNAAEFQDYLPTPKAPEQNSEDPEKLTPVQRLVRSKMGDALEMYFLFQDGQKCQEIASKFLKLHKPATAGPKSWPQLVPCTAGDVRRAVEYVRKWSATLANKAPVLGAARLELAKINKAAVWSELAGRLKAPKETIVMPEIDPGKKRGKEWATADHVSMGSGVGGYFDYDRHLQNVFAARSLKKRESNELPKQAKVSQPAEIENFLSSLSERVGVVRSADAPKLPAKPRAPEPDLPPVWRLTPLAPRKEMETPAQVEKQASGVALDRKKARSLQVEAGLIAIIDGPAPIPHKLRQQLVAIADRLQEGDSVPEIAKRLRTNTTSINRLLSKMKKAAKQQAATYSGSEREPEGQDSPTYAVPSYTNNHEINVLHA